MNILIKRGREALFGFILVFAMVAGSGRTSLAADAKPPGQKELSADDKLSVREVQLALSKAQSRAQEAIQQAQQEVAAAQQAFQQIVRELEKKCGGKVNELPSGNGKLELVCTAGKTNPEDETRPK